MLTYRHLLTVVVRRNYLGQHWTPFLHSNRCAYHRSLSVRAEPNPFWSSQ